MYAKVDQYFEEVLCIFFLSVVVGSVLMQVVLRFFFHTARCMGRRNCHIWYDLCCLPWSHNGGA